jgi:copper homeostasis protein
MSRKLEIACFNLQSAFIAVDANADRIEFCADYSTGGVTPFLADFQQLRKHTHVPIHIMIRARAGHFHYTSDELDDMVESVRLFHQAGADGFVFGCLQSDYTIDAKANAKLLAAAKGKPCTFHRAFDEIPDWQSALEQLIDLGFSSILSSGRGQTAMDGIATLQAMQQAAKGRISIIAGGALRSKNLAEFAKHFQTDYYHSAALLDDKEWADAGEIQQMKAVFE